MMLRMQGPSHIGCLEVVPLIYVYCPMVLLGRIHPGKGFHQLGHSTASDKSDVTRVEGSGAVSTLLRLNKFHLQAALYLVKNSV